MTVYGRKRRTTEDRQAFRCEIIYDWTIPCWRGSRCGSDSWRVECRPAVWQ